MLTIERFDHLICLPTLSVREVLSRIEAASPNLFQIIVSSDGMVLGTATDGDIRRAMLAGVTMEHPISSSMNTAPIVGHMGTPEKNQELVHSAYFLPVVNDRGRLAQILIGRRGDIAVRRALVMAGGFGRRLGGLTLETPKPLLPVGGRPMLEGILSRLEVAGVTEIYVALHYLADKVEQFVADRSSRAVIKLLHEDQPLGTAGALSMLPRDEAVLVINGDVVSDVDFSSLQRFHERHRYDGTVAVTRHEVTVPFGVVRHTADGLFAGIDEKPSYTQFVAAGIYLLSAEFLPLVPPNACMQMPDLLNLGKQVGLKVGVFPVHEAWIDVGRPADLQRARDEAQGKSDAP